MAMLNRLRSCWNQLPEVVRFVLPIWLGMRLLSHLIGFWVWRIRPLPPPVGMRFYEGLEPVVQGWRGALFGVWQRWDTIFYQIIAEQGYSVQKVSLFFPLYPLTARVLAQLTGMGTLEALYVVSTLGYLAALILLYALLADTFNTTIARRGVLALAVFPSSFFFLALYPQSMELALVLASVFLARKRRWLGSAVTALLAGLTHSTALPLAVILLVEAVQFIRRNTHPWRWTVLGVAGMPALGVGWFWAWRVSQGFPSFLQSYEQEFFRYPAPPWTNLVKWLMLLPQHLSSPDWVINSVALFLVVWSLIWGWKKIPASWLAFQALVLFMALGLGDARDPLFAYNRYILMGFSLFAALGWWADTPLKRLTGFALGVFGQLALMALFLLWIFIG
ncbi:hypothetical protein [Anaerolinea thermophila]|nr:hypothetical protein [Anaerolinea thermophila]